MRKRVPHSRLQPIGEVLFATLKRRGMAVQLEENTAFKLWPKAVGAPIAAQTQPDGWRSGILFVRTTSSVWVQQLCFMKDDIRKKINDLAKKNLVRDIHFTVGYKPNPVGSGKKASGFAKLLLRERDRKMINECTSQLADAELADTIKRVMKLEISRRRHLEEKKRGRRGAGTN